MEKLIHAVQDWPVLVQGVIGSALFWLILVAGQRVSAVAGRWVASASTKRRIGEINNEIARLRVLRTGEPAFLLILLYRAARDLVRGLIWLTLGLIFGAVFPAMGLLGFIGCLFYLFRALALIGPMREISRGSDALKFALANLETERNLHKSEPDSG